MDSLKWQTCLSPAEWSRVQCVLKRKFEQVQDIPYNTQGGRDGSISVTSKKYPSQSEYKRF